jgi:hypothetical protein
MPHRATLPVRSKRGAVQWKSIHPGCKQAFVSDPFDAPILSLDLDALAKKVQSTVTPLEISNFINQSVSKIPQPKIRDIAAARMRKALVDGDNNKEVAASAELWHKCASEPPQAEEFAHELASLLLRLTCESPDIDNAFALGIIRNWVWGFENQRPAISVYLARGLLDDVPGRCKPRKNLPESVRNRLVSFVDAATKRERASPPLPAADMQAVFEHWFME